MRRLNVPRLVVISEAGYGDHVSGFLNQAVTSVYGVTQRSLVRERIAQDGIVRDSGLHWTIIRPTILTSGPASGRLRPALVPHRAFLPRTSRPDLAALVLKSLGNSSTFGRNMYL